MDIFIQNSGKDSISRMKYQIYLGISDVRTHFNDFAASVRNRGGRVKSKFMFNFSHHA